MLENVNKKIKFFTIALIICFFPLYKYFFMTNIIIYSYNNIYVTRVDEINYFTDNKMKFYYGKYKYNFPKSYHYTYINHKGYDIGLFFFPNKKVGIGIEENEFKNVKLDTNFINMQKLIDYYPTVRQQLNKINFRDGLIISDENIYFRSYKFKDKYFSVGKITLSSIPGAEKRMNKNSKVKIEYVN